MSSAEAAAAADAEEEEEKQRRQRKLEEALEVKSLRRIISAYLNYSDAAEDDVRRYERSFRKLQPAHKALLSHLPLKFQRLRRCISLNSFFILNMLQAFDPPLDMSHDSDICDCENEKNAHDNLIQSEASHCKEMKFGSEQHTSTSGRTGSCKHEEPSCEEEKNIINSPSGRAGTEEVQMKSFCESVTGSCSVSSETCVVTGSIDVKPVTDERRHSSVSNANGYVTSQSPDWLDPSLRLNVPLVDVDKVRCIIRNVVRDWAPEGRRERDECYKPILEELDRLFPARCKSRPPSCLVPGAGLGRLALDISCLGFISQGNEFSYYMMICSSFILNHTHTMFEWTIYPWIHSNCNSLSDNDQLRPVKFPDIHPASAGITEGFSMCGGDFVEVYSDPSQYGAWDAVVTCFFLDTAHNIVEYIEVISRILKDGGVWINLGPLLYHFADAYGPEDEMSIELSLEDVKKVAFHYGFEMEMEKTVETTYTANLQSMMQTHYFAAFWTMKKGKAL